MQNGSIAELSTLCKIKNLLLGTYLRVLTTAVIEVEPLDSGMNKVKWILLRKFLYKNLQYAWRLLPFLPPFNFI